MRLSYRIDESVPNFVRLFATPPFYPKSNNDIL